MKLTSQEERWAKMLEMLSIDETEINKRPNDVGDHWFIRNEESIKHGYGSAEEFWKHVSGNYPNDVLHESMEDGRDVVYLRALLSTRIGTSGADLTMDQTQGRIIAIAPIAYYYEQNKEAIRKARLEWEEVAREAA